MLNRFLKLLRSPSLALERIGQAAAQKRRLARLRNSPARLLNSLQIDQLELLDLVQPLKIDVAYDIGANSGAWTLLAKSIMPELRVEAFEPLERFSDWNIPGTRFHAVALGRESRRATMRTTSFADASSILPLADESRTQFGVEEVGTASVDLVALDEFRKEKGLPFPDLIKLDVQGYELEVLKGGAECVASAKAVISEVAFVELYRGQAEFHEIVAFMAEHGLFVHAFGHSHAPGSRLLYLDILFTRKAS